MHIRCKYNVTGNIQNIPINTILTEDKQFFFSITKPKINLNQL